MFDRSLLNTHTVQAVARLESSTPLPVNRLLEDRWGNPKDTHEAASGPCWGSVRLAEIQWLPHFWVGTSYVFHRLDAAEQPDAARNAITRAVVATVALTFTLCSKSEALSPPSPTWLCMLQLVAPWVCGSAALSAPKLDLRA